MTVTYTEEVATSADRLPRFIFLKQLIRWRGSIYKSLWAELVIFVFAYALISLIYRYCLNDSQKQTFESISMYCSSFSDLIPIAFVLGFYVTNILKRWWDQFNAIPWPDQAAVFVSALIHDAEDSNVSDPSHDAEYSKRAQLMRRTIMRYMCLALTLTLRSISVAVKKSFPTLEEITEKGLMTSDEKENFEAIETRHSKYYVPLVWATSIICSARKNGHIKDDFAMKTLIDEINNFRRGLGTLYNYDWISIPLVYTQVVTIAVYTFFLSCLMGRQFIQPKDGPPHRIVDAYVPVFTLLQFLVYMGWLKLAEALINPFGEDDDDLDINIAT